MSLAQALRQEGIEKGQLIGLEEGIAEGEARGEVRGEVRGEARGKVLGEFEAMKRIVLKLLQQGISIDQIMQLTELSEQEIEAILLMHRVLVYSILMIIRRINDVFRATC